MSSDVRTLVEELLAGRLTRREFMRCAAAAGCSVPLIASLVALADTASAAPAPDATSDSPITPAAPTSPVGPGRVPVTLNVNGTPRTVQIEPRVSLLDALREEMGMTGTKKGCNQGACGACTVHVDGRHINSCLTLAVTVEGRPITTIEGLARGEQLHPMQTAFIEHDGFQCGYCTSGQIMSAVKVIEEGHAGSDAEIREWMSGNICRCSAYPNIVAAVREVAGRAAIQEEG